MSFEELAEQHREIKRLRYLLRHLWEEDLMRHEVEEIRAIVKEEGGDPR